MNPKSNELNCSACEALLMDALDGILTPEEQIAFEHHVASCDACSRMLADAKRGAAWLEMLKSERPEPPADLMHRILAQTSGAQASGIQTIAAENNAIEPVSLPRLVPQPAVSKPRVNVLPFPRRWNVMLQPRLAMTAAMAFFSIALSANLLGISLGSLRPGDLHRSVAQAQARAIQYYDNLGVVAQLESRVHDLQRLSSEDSEQPQANPEGKSQPSQEQNAQPANPSGTSQRNTPQPIPTAAPHIAQLRIPVTPANGRNTLTQEGVQA